MRAALERIVHKTWSGTSSRGPFQSASGWSSTPMCGAAPSPRRWWGPYLCLGTIPRSSCTASSSRSSDRW